MMRIMMLYLAAFLIAALGLAHSYLGERYLLTRLFRRGELPAILGSPAFTERTLRFAWHLTTIFGLGIALVLVQIAGQAPAPQLVAALGWTFMLSGLLPLVFTRGRHLSWVVLFAVGGLCLTWAAGQ